MNTIVNQAAFIKTSRLFPEEAHDLSLELNKAYIDIARTINDRTIGIFPITSQAITGEGWFVSNNARQQTLRQVFTFTTTASINHNIKNVVANQFTRCFGSYTDGTNNYGLFWATSVAIPGQITFYVTATQIVFVVGAGAPALTSGRIILEWLSQP